MTPARLPDTFPIALEQRASRSSSLLKLAILLPATVALLAPFLMVAKAVASDPGVRAILEAKPATLLQLVFGLAFWAVLFALPLHRLAQGLGQSRTVAIDGSIVTITERRPLRVRTWTVDLSAYAGLAHHVRSSLSGVRHELILAHPERRNSVLLAISDRFGQDEIDRVATLLGQRQIPSRMIYRLAGRALLGGPATVAAPAA